uniref:Ras-GEF domain-containing protein n=1 Tax=Otolemur garnettii TaxID=30611 RepID=H0XTT0_OTOGA
LTSVSPSPPSLGDQRPALEPGTHVALDLPLSMEPAPGPVSRAAPAPRTEPAPVATGEAPPEPIPGLCHPSAVREKKQHRAGLCPIMAYTATHLAQQLTLMDAEQFKKVLPWECLGSIWTEQERRDKELVVPTISAALSHFYHVADFVLPTCLGTCTMKAQDRARVLGLWCWRCQECTTLRNYSSSRATVTALECPPIHQLKKPWRAVSRRSLISFFPLCTEKAPELMNDCVHKLGISKLASVENNLQRAQMRQWRRKQGIIPCLGTFLTNLVLLKKRTHNAMDDWTSREGGVHSMKLQAIKILQQLQLLQVTVENFRFELDKEFQSWFQTMKRLDQEDKLELSVSSHVH